MPKTVSENIKRLSKWQELFSGDSFDFDYHLIWDHYHDPGGYEAARILFEDMKNLDKLGLNGMISCQVQRAFFPTGLAISGMAAALWNRELEFDNFASDYFMDLFGNESDGMKKYFHKLSELFQPPYLRVELPQVSEKSVELFDEIPKVINKMMPKFLELYGASVTIQDKSLWQTLIIHAQLCIYLALALKEKANGKLESAMEIWDLTKDYITSVELDIHELFDVKYFIDVIERSIHGEKQFDV
jgi:hypothetical protein